MVPYFVLWQPQEVCVFFYVFYSFIFLFFSLLFQRKEEELSRGENTAYKKKKREKRRKTKEKDMSITPEMKLISVKSAAPSPRQITKSFSSSYIIRKFYNL